jgi:hypothetical protein
MKSKYSQTKQLFKQQLKTFAETLGGHVSTKDYQWTIKGFIDVFQNIYTISADTKIVSKILEIHLFPELLKFAETNGYRIVLADHQNYYPDLSFVSAKDESVKFAVDLKTTYRLPKHSEFCNGFTLGSHGNYFKDRDKRKNIQFPYNEYIGHFCLGAIYTRADSCDIIETKNLKLLNLNQSFLLSRRFSFLLVKNGRLRVIHREAVTLPTSAASFPLKIFCKVTAYSKILENLGLMTIG